MVKIAFLLTALSDRDLLHEPQASIQMASFPAGSHFIECSAKRDASAAERFFRKTLGAAHTQTPRVINVDKNAADPKATDTLTADETLPEAVELRQNKYLNNLSSNV